MITFLSLSRGLAAASTGVPWVRWGPWFDCLGFHGGRGPGPVRPREPRPRPTCSLPETLPPAPGRSRERRTVEAQRTARRSAGAERALLDCSFFLHGLLLSTIMAPI